MENKNPEDTDLVLLLNSIFYFNKDKNEYKILKNSTYIPLLYKKLISQTTSIEDKTLIVKSLKLSFETIRHYTAVFFKHIIRTESNQSLSLMIILLQEYIKYSDNDQSDNIKKYLEITLAVFQLLISNVTCPRVVFEYIYSLFRPYLYTIPAPETKTLTSERFQRYFNLLSLVYGMNIKPQSPSKYLYFSGNGEISLCLGITELASQNIVTFDKEYSIFTWFKISISKEDFKTYSNDSSVDLINILQKDNSSTRVYFDRNYTLKSTTDSDLAIDLKENIWYFLVFSWNPINNSDLNTKIYLNNYEISSKPIKIGMTSIHIIIFFTRLIGEVSSLLFVEGKQLKTLILLFSQSKFDYGINSEREFIALQKTIDEGAFYNYQTDFISNINSYSSFSSSFYSNCIKFIFMPSRYKQERESEVTLYDNAFDAKITQTNSYSSGVNIFKKNYKKLSQLKALYPLLPLIEIMILSNLKTDLYPLLSNDLSNDILKAYFGLITEIKNNNITKPKFVKGMITFFQLFSLFLEKLPKAYMTFEILEKLHSIISGHDLRIQNPPLSLINEVISKIIVNEKIYFKFPLIIQDAIWEILDKHYSIKEIGNTIPMVKITSILLEMDKDKYTKYCCDNHANMFINNNEDSININICTSSNTTNKVYNLKDRLSNITIFIYKMLSQKPEDIKVLFTLLTFDISPCLQSFIVTMLTDFIDNKFQYNEIKPILSCLFNEDYNGLDILLFALSVTAFDVRLEIISLYKTLYSKFNFFLPKKQIEAQFIFIKVHSIPSKMIIPKREYNNSNSIISNKKNSDEWEKLTQTDSTNDDSGFISVSKDINRSNLLGFRKIELNDNEEYLLRDLNKAKFNNLIDLMGVHLIEWWVGKDCPSYVFDWLISITPYKTILKNFVMLHLMSSDWPKFEYELCRNKHSYIWLIDITFQVFISQDPKLNSALSFNNPDDIEACRKEADDFVTTALKIHLKLCSKSIHLLDHFMQWCYYYKELYQNDNPYYERLISFIRKIIEMESNEIMSLNINLSNPNSKEEKDYLYFCSIVFEYITIFIIGNQFNTEKTLYSQGIKRNIAIPSYYSALFNTHLTEPQRSINERWNNYSLFKIVIDRSIELFKDKVSTDPAKIVENSSKSNQFDISLEILTMANYIQEGKINKGIPLIIILSNSMSFIINEIETETDLNQWLNNYSDFLRYVIVASYYMSQNDVHYDYKQNLTFDLIVIGINVLINQLRKRKVSMIESILEVIKELLKIINAIVQRIHKQAEAENSLNLKDKLLNQAKTMFAKDKSGPKTECAVYKLFAKVFPMKNLVFIKQMLIDNIVFKDFIFNDNILKQLILENQSLLFAVENIFIFNNLFKDRKRSVGDFVPMFDTLCNLPTHSDSVIRIDTNYIEEEYFVFKTRLTEIINRTRKEYNKIYQLYLSQKTFDREKAMKTYRKAKLNMFTFRGLWSDAELYYSKKNILKYKVLDHLTKDYTRPLLFPLIDYEYYLPQFSDFQKKNLFLDKTNPQKLIDIDLFQYYNTNNDIKEEQITSMINEPANILKRIYAAGFDGIKDEKEEEENQKAKSSKYLQLFIKTRMKLNQEKDDLFKYETKEPIPCCLIRGPYHIKGYFHNDSLGIGFYGNDWEYNTNLESFDKERNTCYGSLFRTQLPQKAHYHIFIQYRKMERVFKRRYIFRQTGIEIYTINHKSFYFLFHIQATRSSIWSNIEKHLKTKRIDIDYSKIDKHIGLENINCKFKTSNDNNTGITLSQKIDQWSKWKISTMEMIMYMNILANRSYNDFMQYPVFPWILTDYKTEDTGKQIRNFAQPIGMLDVFSESQNRKESYMQHFDLMLSENSYSNKDSQPSYVYGTHYSNAMYVSYYLMRIFPFTQVKLELQGSCFDNPNRLFSSLESSFNCSATQKADIREVIPEFFCLPEMFENINSLDFGEAVSLDRNTKTRIQGVTLPNWCNDNPYDFVDCYRRKLESPDMNSTITQWFDMIFGFRQKGRKAEEIYNVFLTETYELYEKEFDKLDKKNKEYNCRMIEFGVTPHQIFSSEIDKRKPLLSMQLYNHLTHSFNYIVLLREVMFSNGKEHFDQVSTYIKAAEKDGRLIVYSSNKVMIMKYSERTDEYEKRICQYTCQYYFDLKENDIKIPLCTSNCIASYNKGECIVKGGYINGQMIVYHYSIEKKDISRRYYMQEDMSRITVISIDQEDKFLLCGTEMGIIHMYFISQYESPIDLRYEKSISDHQGEITALHISSRLNVFASASADGFVMLYTIPHCKLFNIIKLADGSLITHLFISSTPLPSVTYYNETDMTWNSYSINGKKLIEPMKIEEGVIKAKLFTDVTFIDHIVYSTKNSNLYVVSLPKFVMKKQCGEELNSVIDFDVTNDKMACVVFDMEEASYYVKTIIDKD